VCVCVYEVSKSFEDLSAWLLRSREPKNFELAY